MNKFERIQLVRILGLNTEESVLVANEEDWHQHRSFLHKFSTFSVRTFGDNWMPRSEPHYPVISREELAERYLSLLGLGLRLIVAKAIDPADAELAGCMLYEGGVFIVEVAFGPVTVRRVTREGYIDLRVEITHAKPSGNDLLDAAVREGDRGLHTLQAMLPTINLEGFLYEFSVYRKPVGWKRHRVIFWELVGPRAQEALAEELLVR